MLSDYFVDERLARTDSDALRILIVLHRLAKQKRPRSMSYEELGQRAGIGGALAKSALQRLAYMGDITFDKNTVTMDFNGVVITMRFTNKDEDTDRELVKENVELRARIEELENGEVSGLAEKFNDDTARVIRVSEGILGRGLQQEEIWYLSELVAKFGPQRVLKSVQTTRNSREPLRATYVRLKRGAMGKEMKPPVSGVDEIKYFEVPVGYDPWAREDE